MGIFHRSEGESKAENLIERAEGKYLQLKDLLKTYAGMYRR